MHWLVIELLEGNQLTPQGQWAEYPPGLFAVNRDASQFKQLAGLNCGKNENA